MYFILNSIAVVSQCDAQCLLWTNRKAADAIWQQWKSESDDSALVFPKCPDEVTLSSGWNGSIPFLQTKCFICGIGNDYFDRTPHGFETHTLQEHNLANYLWATPSPDSGTLLWCLCDANCDCFVLQVLPDVPDQQGWDRAHGSGAYPHASCLWSFSRRLRQIKDISVAFSFFCPLVQHFNPLLVLHKSSRRKKRGLRLFYLVVFWYLLITRHLSFKLPLCDVRALLCHTVVAA